MRVRLIEVPYHLGHEGVGMGAGPERLVEGGVREALASDVHAVRRARVRRGGEEAKENAASLEVARLVAESID